MFVAPNGDGLGAGTLADPVSLDYALSGPSSAALQGKTVYLRGGTYSAPAAGFVQTVDGTALSRITYAAYPGENPIIDGSNVLAVNPVVAIGGDYVTLRDVEITNSTTDRSAARSIGVLKQGAEVRVVNCIVHDTGVAMQDSVTSSGGELAGCVTYNQGYEADTADRGHGHSAYVQNSTTVEKKIRHCSFGPGYGWGYHLYTEGGVIDDITFEACDTYGAGLLSNPSGTFPNARNTDVLGGDGVDAHRLIIRRHCGLDHTMQLDYDGAGTNDTLTLDGYRSLGGLSGLSRWINVTTTQAIATGNTDAVYTEDNPYEVGRGKIAVYNWANASSVAVDLSGIVAVGDMYYIFNAWNLSEVIASGTYEGGTISLPMTGRTFATPVGGWRWGSAPTVPTTVGAFLVRKYATATVAPADADRIAA